MRGRGRGEFVSWRESFLEGGQLVCYTTKFRKFGLQNKAFILHSQQGDMCISALT